MFFVLDILSIIAMDAIFIAFSASASLPFVTKYFSLSVFGNVGAVLAWACLGTMQYTPFTPLTTSAIGQFQVLNIIFSACAAGTCRSSLISLMVSFFNI